MSSQTRRQSMAETLASVAIGLAVSMAAGLVVYPAFGHSFSLSQNAGITAIFTALSIARSYTVRRLFNSLGKGKSTPRQKMKLDLKNPGKMGRPRLLIEKALLELRPGATISNAELAHRALIPRSKCGDIMQRMAILGLAQNISKYTNKAAWAPTDELRRRHRQENTGQRAPTHGEPRVCPSSQPNGSVEYWAKHQAWVMTPARQTAGAQPS